MIVHCKACNHEWEVHTTTPLLRQAIQVMRAAVAVGCPRCAANGNAVLVGVAPRSLDASTDVLNAASIRGDLYSMGARLTLVEAEVTARQRRNARHADKG